MGCARKKSDMFDSTSVRNAQTVNAVSGTLVKTHPKSYFLMGHVNSTNTSNLMGKYKNEVVLQAMLVGDKYLMYEVVNREDYELREEGEGDEA